MAKPTRCVQELNLLDDAVLRLNIDLDESHHGPLPPYEYKASLDNVKKKVNGVARCVRKRNPIHKVK